MSRKYILLFYGSFKLAFKVLLEAVSDNRSHLELLRSLENLTVDLVDQLIVWIYTIKLTDYICTLDAPGIIVWAGSGSGF